MNIIVVVDRYDNARNFIHDATDWVMNHPDTKSLYHVTGSVRVRIGAYYIKFVHRVTDVRGLRAIDILFYYNTPSTVGDWELIHRMSTDGKKFVLLDEFMEEVFRRVKEEQIKAKLNALSGHRPMSINYPEYFLKLKKESQNKISDVQDILDYNVATVYDAVREASEREAMDRIKYEKMALLKEETTMNCDIRSNIKDVIFSDRVTIILWKDGTKTMVRVGKREPYDPEKGFAMAVCKKMFGNGGNYYEVFKKYVPVTYYIVNKKDAKKDIVITDSAVSDELEKEITGMINECQEKGKIWPGLTRQKWKELVNKVAKRVADKRKREEAEVDYKKKKEGIRSGKYPWGMDMSKYMTPPEEGVNSSGKEE